MEIRDKDGELIPVDVVLPNFETFIKRGGMLNLNHENWTIGKVLSGEKRMKEDVGEYGIYGTCQVFDDFPIDDQVWDWIKNGELDAVSLAGQFEIDKNGNASWGAPMEVSVTGPAVDSSPVNEESTIEAVSRAKSEDNEKGGYVKKSEIDEKLNKKSDSEIDEKIKKKSDADSDADALKMKDDAEEEAEAKKTKSDAEMESEAKAKKPDSDSDAWKQKAEESFTNLNERLSRIEEMLDMLMQEEEEEHSTDHAIEKSDAEQKPGTGAGSAEKMPEIPAQVAKMGKELSELKAQMGKILAQGQKKTLQSGEGNDISEEVAYVTSVLG